MRMKIDGDEVTVGVAHITKKNGQRGTQAWLRVDGGTTLEGKAMCSLSDNFNKRVGRRLAANRLLEKVREKGLFEKKDRKAIFQAICPEYASPPARDASPARPPSTEAANAPA